MQEDIRFLKEFQQELKTQEHDCQAAPRFWVIMDHEYQITEEGYHNRVSVYDPNASESYEIEEYAKSQLEDDCLSKDDDIAELKAIMDGNEYFKESDLIEWVKENRDELTIFYEKEVDVIKQNTLFLTKQEAKDHLKANSHHYSKKAHTYAMTAWRAPKVAKLLNILENFSWADLENDRECISKMAQRLKAFEEKMFG